MQISTSGAAMRRSRVWKLIVALGGAAVIASAGISGCQHDEPLAPRTIAPPGPSHWRYPTEEEYAEMPPEFRQTPSIIEAWVEAGFVGNRAYGQAAMQFLANYARITLPVTLLFNNREVTKTVGLSEQSYYLPAIRWITAVASVGTKGTCGHTVNVHGEFYIHNQFPLKTGWFEWKREGTSRHASASQPECTCSATAVTDSAYDPYSSGEGDTTCDGSGSGGEGSGTQFYPGDQTGGETVDFHTGVGNGGESACGAAAVVEFVCIDIWNENTQQWEEYACGYVTTC